MVRKSEEFTWKDVDILPYKEDGTHFKSITRQTLFVGTDDLPVELRYFEIGPGGHSTLEKHQHQHKVMIIRGSGKVFVKDSVTEIGMNDLVHIPAWTWHQFRAVNDEPLGFLCIVANDRDRPTRPQDVDIEALSKHEAVKEFIRF